MQQIQVPAQSRERRPQFVRDVCDKVPLHLEGIFHFLKDILQMSEHGVERIYQLTNFIGRTRIIHATCEVTFVADLLRNL
jgi:hypothetical protein